MNLHLEWKVLFVIAACIFHTTAPAQQAADTPCPNSQDMTAERLHGLWSVRFTAPPDGLPTEASMRLQRHAEFSESLAGSVSRNFGWAAGSAKIAGHASRAALAGDLDSGMLLLDESSDNVSITGTWNGEMVAGSCGKVYQGSWKDTSHSAPDHAVDVPFTMTRLP